MSAFLRRLPVSSSYSALLQGVVDVETDVRLKEFLADVQREDSCTLTPSSSLRLMAAPPKNPGVKAELRVQALRRLDEVLTAALHLPAASDLVEICTATIWNLARPCLGTAFRRTVSRHLHKVGKKHVLRR